MSGLRSLWRTASLGPKGFFGSAKVVVVRNTALTPPTAALRDLRSQQRLHHGVLGHPQVRPEHG